MGTAANEDRGPGEARPVSLIDRDGLEALVALLIRRGYEVIGPVLRGGAVVLDRLSSSSDLPRGWTDDQGPGSYRLRALGDGALFGYAVGPHSWKAFLHPAAVRLWRARRVRAGFRVEEDDVAHPRFAFLGVRPCDLSAIAIQDEILLRGRPFDPVYESRREGAFIVAANCTSAGGTCFCSSMNTGPRAGNGFDIALTEILEPERHEFLVEIGSERGLDIVSELPRRPADKRDLEAADDRIRRAESQMGRRLETEGLKELLERNLEHPRWDDVGARCLSCANCTMVCPTCFCTTIEDTSDLAGSEAERWRRWDSCFSLSFSYLHGGSVRTSARSRYRQWMTHKLASWIDQFGKSGCVGCGRCITWCPVGIDITEEARAIRSASGSAAARKGAIHA